MAAHVYGTPHILEHAELLRLLEATVEQNEPDWRVSSLPADYIRRMMAAVVGFELSITRIESKRKLSQNRPVQDRQRVIAALRGLGGDAARDAAEEMERELQR